MKRSIFRSIGIKVLVFVVSLLILSVAVFCVARLASGDPLVSYGTADLMQ